MSLLTLSNVSKSYAGAPALRAVSFAVAPGEIHALMGENGAGKSTLIKILAGVVMPDRAGITIDGRPVTIDDPAAAFGLGLRFIHQELSVVPTVSVAENIFLGRPYPRRLGPFVAWRQLAEEGRRALLRLGITHIDPRRKMARLGVGDQMLVRISSAFLEAGTGATARLTVMDEPTAALSGEESERLFAVLREIRRAGGSVLYVSHRIDEVMRLCDRVTVLRDGALIATTPIRGTSQDEIIRMMTGRQAMEAYPPPLAPAGDEPILEVRGLAGAGLGPLDFDLRKGEIVGIAGLAGAGQSEVLRLVAGAESATAGTIRFERSELPPGSPAAAWARGFAYVPRERRAEGLVLSITVAENVTLPHLRRFSRAVAFLARRRERAFASEQGGRVRLKARGMTQRCRELSGGNQQKVVFARALGGNPRVLLLDEPTRGVDVGARIDIYSIIRQLSAAGAAVLIASSDFPEMLGLCDRIIVMRDGVIAETVSARGLTEEVLIRHCYGPGRSSGSPAASATGAA